jgi:paraquat-inducible protein B
MSHKANSILIGAFVFGAIILGMIVILLLAGRELFQGRRQHIMYFDQTAQGLQVGAPVVFLGVKVGTVKEIRLGLDEEIHRFMVPVSVVLAPHAAQTSAGEEINLQDRSTIRHLVDRGLRAQLQMQSLLTGQLYVDLAFYPDKPARFISDDPEISEIPTIPTALEELSAILENFHMTEFLADLSAISSSLRVFLSSEALKTIPDRLDTILIHLDSLTARLDSDGGPLLAEARAGLKELHQAIDAVQAAMDKVGLAADRVGALAEEDSMFYESVSQAGTEMATAAEGLRQLVDEDSPTVQRINMSLQEISRAARAFRGLAESLELQPDAVLRGKRNGELK